MFYDACNNNIRWQHSPRRAYRLRRVPDILPVSLQDFLHRFKPVLRARNKTVGLHPTPHKLFEKSLTKTLIFSVLMKGQGMKSLVGVWGGQPQGLWTHISDVRLFLFVLV